MSHKYLKSTTVAKSAASSNKENKDVDLFSKLSAVLTPNTRRGIERAMGKLSAGSEELSALKKLDL